MRGGGGGEGRWGEKRRGEGRGGEERGGIIKYITVITYASHQALAQLVYTYLALF